MSWTAWRARHGATVQSLLGSAVVSWLLLPMPILAGDPLRTTLAALPLVGVAFWGIAHAVERAGGRRYPAVFARGEIVAGLLLASLALGRGPLGFGGLEGVIVAGLALVLAHRVGRQLLAMRPLLGQTLPSRPSYLFFALPFVAYLAILPWSTERRPPDGDEPYYLLVTHSLAYDFDADLTDDYADGDWKGFLDRPIGPQPGDPVGPHGEKYSRHNEALPMLLAPSYRLFGLGGALATMAALSAALAWTTLRLARRYPRLSPSAALWGYALTAFTPPLLLYSGQVWVEVPAALLSIIALDQIRTEARPGPWGWGWKRWLGIGLPILLLPLLKIRFLLLAGPLLMLAWWYAGRPKRPLLVIAGLLAAVAAGILIHNQMLYGNPLKIHTWQEVEPTSYGVVEYARGFLGLFFDAAFGLFGAAPIWFLVIPCLFVLIRERHPLPIDLVVFSLPYLAVVAPRAEWYGGWSPPFRYALIALPLLGIAVGPWVERRREPLWRGLAAGLGLATLALSLLWIAQPGWTYNFADGRTYLLDHLASRLGLDVARLFPSSIRLRPATWIWPILAFALAGWLAFARRAKARGRGLRTAGLWGGALALLSAAAVLPLAARLPTRVVEFEDLQIQKQGGHLEPERWVVDRTRFRGSWVLREGESLSAPITAGGQRATIELQAFFVRHHPAPFRVEVQAGDVPLATAEFTANEIWQERSLGPFDWPRGAPLKLSVRYPDGPVAGGMPNGVLLDKAVFSWD